MNKAFAEIAKVCIFVSIAMWLGIILAMLAGR
jgi:hypothetical protein